MLFLGLGLILVFTGASGLSGPSLPYGRALGCSLRATLVGAFAGGYALYHTETWWVPLVVWVGVWFVLSAVLGVRSERAYCRDREAALLDEERLRARVRTRIARGG